MKEDELCHVTCWRPVEASVRHDCTSRTGRDPSLTSAVRENESMKQKQKNSKQKTQNKQTKAVNKPN